MPHALIAALGLAGALSAQPVDVVLTPPDLDRWFYGFNGTPGSRIDASFFGAIGEIEFDDRDAQTILGWETDTDVTPGLGEDHYRILSLSVEVVISRDFAFTYDPTFDTLDTFLTPTNDTDAGRPLELYGLGFRNDWSQANFTESTPYSDGELFPVPAVSIRNAFVANFDASFVPFDISNNVEEGFEVEPIAIGVADALSAGALVPAGTSFVFDVDLTNVDGVRYIRQGLDSGRLLLGISALTSTSQGDPQVPAIYMKENPLNDAVPASLHLNVCAGPPADRDCSGIVDIVDLLAFLSEWFGGSADFNLDGTTDIVDLLAFLSLWFEG